ncbi:hypothetical protein ACFQ2M_28795 [Kitasatospora saccharophila]
MPINERCPTTCHSANSASSVPASRSASAAVPARRRRTSPPARRATPS